MDLQIVNTDGAPKAIGPYSQAVKAGGFVFCSGQVALKPGTSEFEDGDVDQQTRRVLGNLRAVLEAAGSSMQKVVKATVFLADMADFPRVNEIYGQCFEGARPARATFAVAALPKGAKVEIDAIAVV